MQRKIREKNGDGGVGCTTSVGTPTHVIPQRSKGSARTTSVVGKGLYSASKDR